MDNKQKKIIWKRTDEKIFEMTVLYWKQKYKQNKKKNATIYEREKRQHQWR
jgi:hypothetical protein